MNGRSNTVDVIAVHNADGSIKPLRIRLEDGQRQLLRINVDEVVSVKEIRHVGAEAILYCCRSHFGGREWVFELKFSIRSHSWHWLGNTH